MTARNLLDRLRGEKGVRLAVIAGLAGMGLILLSTLLPRQTAATGTTSSAADPDAYARRLEQRLAALVGAIRGVGRCDVLVTLASGSEYVYATEEKNAVRRSEDNLESRQSVDQQNSGEQQVLVLRTGDGEQALLVTEIAPRVSGVVVCCAGGGDPAVAAQVVQAVTTALDISAARVCVTARQP